VSGRRGAEFRASGSGRGRGSGARSRERGGGRKWQREGREEAELSAGGHFGGRTAATADRSRARTNGRSNERASVANAHSLSSALSAALSAPSPKGRSSLLAAHCSAMDVHCSLLSRSALTAQHALTRKVSEQAGAWRAAKVSRQQLAATVCRAQTGPRTWPASVTVAALSLLAARSAASWQAGKLRGAPPDCLGRVCLGRAWRLETGLWTAPVDPGGSRTGQSRALSGEGSVESGGSFPKVHSLEWRPPLTSRRQRTPLAASAHLQLDKSADKQAPHEHANRRAEFAASQPATVHSATASARATRLQPASRALNQRPTGTQRKFAKCLARVWQEFAKFAKSSAAPLPPPEAPTASSSRRQK